MPINTSTAVPDVSRGLLLLRRLDFNVPVLLLLSQGISQGEDLSHRADITLPT